MDAEFREHHVPVVDELNNDEELKHEQAVLDEHDDKVTYITVHLDHLTNREDASVSVKVDGKTQQLLHKCLANIERSIRRVNVGIEPITPGPDVDHCLLEQYMDQISRVKLELFDVLQSIVAVKDSANLLDRDPYI